MFRGQIEILGVLLERVGVRTGIVMFDGLAVYIAVTYWQRQRIYRALRIARITLREWRKADALYDAADADLFSHHCGRQSHLRSHSYFGVHFLQKESGVNAMRDRAASLTERTVRSEVAGASTNPGQLLGKGNVDYSRAADFRS
jgi:hypothetical protein